MKHRWIKFFLCEEHDGGGAGGGGGEVVADPNDSGAISVVAARDAAKAGSGAAGAGETPPVVDDPVGEAGGELAAAAAGGEGAEETPAFTPNFKFKADREEKEIPEHFRALIKDEATQNEIRELFEKAHGLEPVKTRYAEARTQVQQLSEQLTTVQSELQDLAADVQADDWESFFKKLGVPEERALQYFINRANYQKLPPDQQAAHDRARLASTQARETQRQFQTQEKASQARHAMLMQQLLNFGLEQPAVKEFSAQIDAKAGKAGTFAAQVIEYGKMMAGIGQEVSPQDAIQAVMQRYQPFLTAPGAAATTTAGGSAEAGGAKPKPKGLPNLGGGGSAPVRKGGIESLDQLKKRREELAARAAGG